MDDAGEEGWLFVRRRERDAEEGGPRDGGAGGERKGKVGRHCAGTRLGRCRDTAVGGMLRFDHVLDRRMGRQRGVGELCFLAESDTSRERMLADEFLLGSFLLHPSLKIWVPTQ